MKIIQIHNLVYRIQPEGARAVTHFSSRCLGCWKTRINAAALRNFYRGAEMNLAPADGAMWIESFQSMRENPQSTEITWSFVYLSIPWSLWSTLTWLFCSLAAVNSRCLSHVWTQTPNTPNMREIQKTNLVPVCLEGLKINGAPWLTRLCMSEECSKGAKEVNINDGIILILFYSSLALF